MAHGEVGCPTGRAGAGLGARRRDGAGRREARRRAAESGRAATSDRPGRRAGALGHHDFRRHALLEHDDDAVAPAAGRQDVDRVALAGAATEENSDCVHAARLEHVGRRHADPAPQAAPLRRRGGNEVLGLARHGGDALPVTGVDGLCGCLSDDAPQRARPQNAKGQKPPTRQVWYRLGDCASAELHDWISGSRAEPSDCP